jgi:hypothetical protein
MTPSIDPYACVYVFVILISCSIRRTPLHSSAQYGRIEVIQLLLLCDADVDARDDKYRLYLTTASLIEILC